MKPWNQLAADRYYSLESSLTDTQPLIIDTEANPQDILECAVQRLRASSDLLKTLYCLSFKQACYDKVCRSNYLASLRIEGFETVPANAAESLPVRQQILDRYRHNTR